MDPGVAAVNSLWIRPRRMRSLRLVVEQLQATAFSGVL
jgi:hypothetical protein